MAEKNDKSLVAKYDDAFRGYDLDGCDNEFNVFAMNQFECQLRWCEVEQKILSMKHQLNEANKLTSKLELQNHHINMLLKEEVKGRSRIQEEKRHIQNQMEKVKDFLSEEDNIREETKEKLHFLSCGRYPHLNMNSNARPIDKLDTISEGNSSRTLSTKSEEEQSMEDLEISGAVRSYRDYIRNNKSLAQFEEESKVKPLCRSSGTQMELFTEECLVATTKVSVSHDGTTVATSIIESRPTTSNEGATSDEGLMTTNQKHCYKRQTIIHQVENCIPCGLRIKFGKPALKCIKCGKSCHVDCESRMPSTCALKSCCKTSRELASTQKTKGPLRFFSSPSTKN